MNFVEFQSSKVWHDDLNMPLYEFYGGPGYVYLGDLVIQHVNGQWYLVIGNQEWISDDLAELEVRLFEFACGEELL